MPNKVPAEYTACPRVMISALRGGSGKTVLTIGIIGALREEGIPIAPFKKGPDYIDAGWLALAADRHCYNLDSYLMAADQVCHSFLNRVTKTDLAVIEGNRGLYDGIDIYGETSSAEIAKLLSIPVILCIDGTKSTRTMAAAVLGCQTFDQEIVISGVILNRVAGTRHENILRRSIEHHCGIPVIGAMPKLKSADFPERHMGLVPKCEHSWATASIAAASRLASQYIDLAALRKIADTADQNSICAKKPLSPPKKQQKASGVRLGVIRDSAFQFYYQENLEALEEEGAELIFMSPFKAESFPEIDGLYIGGGFPETHAQQLAANTSFNAVIKQLAEDGMPIYAECGGLMYMGEALLVDGKTYPMTGVLPIVCGISKRPQGHGYTQIKVDRPNPFFPLDLELNGHEFRYSRILEFRGTEEQMAFKMVRGTGFKDSKDGVFYKNVLATYTHIHALGVPTWAQSLVRKARMYRKQRADYSSSMIK